MADAEPAFKALTWLREVLSAGCTLDAQESIVLLCLVRHAARDKCESGPAGSCFPGMGTIASETRVSRRKVVLALKELRRRGVVTSDTRKLGKGFAVNKYQLPLTPPTSALCAPGSAPDAPLLVHQVHGGSARGAHKLSKELSVGNDQGNASELPSAEYFAALDGVKELNSLRKAEERRTRKAKTSQR